MYQNYEVNEIKKLKNKLRPKNVRLFRRNSCKEGIFG